MPRRQFLLLLLPAALFFSAFFLLPMARLFFIGASGESGWLAYLAIVTDANYFRALWTTLAVAAVTTVLTLAITASPASSSSATVFPGAPRWSPR